MSSASTATSSASSVPCASSSNCQSSLSSSSSSSSLQVDSKSLKFLADAKQEELSLYQPRARAGKTRARCWQDFRLSRKVKGKALCIRCNLWFTYCRSTSSLNSHFDKHHQQAASAQSQPSKSQTKSKPLLSNQTTLSSFLNKSQSNRRSVADHDRALVQFLTFDMRSVFGVRCHHFFFDCLKFVARFCVDCNLRPLNLVEGEGFKLFVSDLCPSYVPPSVKTLRKYIDLFYNEVFNQVNI